MRNGGKLTVLIVTAATLLAAGCNDGTPPAKMPGKAPHAHPSEGPHGGALIEWGDEEYHLEFTVDHAAREATVYVLDESATKAKPIKAATLTLLVRNVAPPVTIELRAKPDSGDPEGSSSRFVGVHDALGTEMEFEGEVTGTVDGTPYAGDFKEKAHKDHKHEKK